MGKPVLPVTIWNHQGGSASVEAVFDSASYYTIVRQDCLPPGTVVIPFSTPREWGTAAAGAKLRVVANTILEIEIRDKRIQAMASVAPELPRPLIIGAGTMQSWDISLVNQNGCTEVRVGLDMRDPDVNLVL